MSESEEIKRLLNFYSSSFYEKYRKLAEPLNQCFGLDALFYSMTTPDGYFFQIGNLADPAHHYFSNQFYKHNPFICHPDNYNHNQIIITMDYPHKTYHDIQHKMQERFGVGDTLVLYKKFEDSAHIFMPTSTNPKVPLNTIYLNNLSALNHFADYFVKEWRQYLIKMEPYMFNLEKHMGAKFFKSIQSKPTLTETAQREKFLRQIGVLDNQRCDVKSLSSREKDCIEEFLKGKSAAQIALALNLGRRTVEHYMDNIKMKLDCNSKSELFERLLVFKTHNLL